jgi:hypothetical protein
LVELPQQIELKVARLNAAGAAQPYDRKTLRAM